MGCINSKPHPKRRLPRRGSLEKGSSRAYSSRIEDSSRSRDGFERFDSVEVKDKFVDKERYGSTRLYDDQAEKKQDTEGGHMVSPGLGRVSTWLYDDQVEKKQDPEAGHMGSTGLGRVPSVVVHPGFGTVPKAAELEQVAAGWPTWLVSVAREALAGWVPRRASTFEKLEKIGQGTYSNVYRARDLTHNKTVALKKVRFDLNDLESVKFMAREIIILRRLDHPNIIKLEGLITAPVSCSLYLVFEYMEHDLLGLASLPGIKFSEPQVKCYMHQLLSGLDHCHSHGVLHRDVKASNLLIDRNGILKIADFGLASFFDPDNIVPMTSRVVTLWYRAPELLLGASHYGAGVDLWSTGCILGELYANKPILPGTTEVEQLHKIFKLCGSPSEDYWGKLKQPPSTMFKPVHQYKRRIAETFNHFPAPVTSLIDSLISIDPDHRGSAATALKSKFFTTEPFACDPSSLPKYPPSKEIDVKMCNEARRQGAVGERIEKTACETKGLKEPPALKADASYSTTTQKQYPDSKSRSHVYKSCKEDRASGFPVPPSRQEQTIKDVIKDFTEHSRTKFFLSGPLVKNRNLGRSIYFKEHVAPSRTVTSRAIPSRLSVLGSNETSSNPSQAGSNQPGVDQGSCCRSDSMEKQVKTYNERSWFGPGGNKIYMSGPLLVPSNKVDQMLEEHDLQLQEFARQARRNDRTELG